MLAIEAQNVQKKFGKKVAVDNISMEVAKGSIHAILGPNGAGKTTFVKILTTLLKPNSGTIHVLGNDLAKDAGKVRSCISLTGQNASVDEELTGYENLYLVARLLGFSPSEAKTRCNDLLTSFELTEAAKKLVKNYSGGMRRRLDIAASIAKIPEILFLDEPTTGLDPRSRNNLWAVIKELSNRGTTVVLTTQYLEEADQLADKITVIDKGKVVSEGTSDELKTSVGHNVLHLFPEENEITDFHEKIITLFPAINRDQINIDNRKISITVGSTAQALEVLKKIQDENISLKSFSLARPNLDEVFLALTGEKSDEDNDKEEEALLNREKLEHVITTTQKRLKASVLTDKFMFGWRTLLKIKHIPEQFMDVLITPIMFTFMFTYLFGGALAGSTSDYLQFFIPGILVQTLTFNAMYAGLNVNSDISKGVFDRFKSMPIWTPSPLMGIFIGDCLRHIISGIIVLLFGMLLGFRIESGFLSIVLVFAIIMLFALSLSWFFIILGITMRSASAVMSLGWLILMPIVFMSNIFADPATMPEWLQTIISYNPLAWQVDAVRAILSGDPSGAIIMKALLASVVITVVLAPIAIFLYKKER